MRLNGEEYYPIHFCLNCIVEYIYTTKRVMIRPILNTQDKKEMDIFLKLANIAIHWKENL